MDKLTRGDAESFHKKIKAAEKNDFHGRFMNISGKIRSMRKRKSSKTHGGARANAGRKPKPGGAMRYVGLSITPSQDAYISALAAEMGTTCPETIRLIIQRFMERG